MRQYDFIKKLCYKIINEQEYNYPQRILYLICSQIKYTLLYFPLQRQETNKRTSRPRCSEQNKDQLGLKNTHVSLEKIILQDFEYHQSISY